MVSMVTRLRLSFIISLFLAISACGSASKSTLLPNYKNTIEKTSAFIKQGMADNNVVGLSIALIDGDKMVWSEGFGWADKENNIPAASNTVYMLGSGTKTMTAVALLRLHEEGVISLDNPARNYLPEFTMAGRFPSQMQNITVRRLLNHHSGIPGDINSFMEILPDKKLGVIVLSNSDTANIFIYAVVREALQNAVKEKFGIAPVSPQLPQYVSIQDADLIAGMYVRKEGYDRIARNTDGTLTWAIGAQTDTPVQRNLQYDG